MNSETLGLLFTANHPTSVPLCEPEFQGHFWPHAYHNMIYSINYPTSCPNSPWIVIDCPNGFQKFQQLGSKFWNRSNGPSRPQSYSVTPLPDEVHSICNCRGACICAPSAIVKDKIVKFSKNCGTFSI